MANRQGYQPEDGPRPKPPGGLPSYREVCAELAALKDVFRSKKFRSGCVCHIDDDTETVVELCELHREREDKLRAELAASQDKTEDLQRQVEDFIVGHSNGVDREFKLRAELADANETLELWEKLREFVLDTEYTRRVRARIDAALVKGRRG